MQTVRAGEEAGDAIEAVLRHEAREHLAPYKAPKVFVFVDEITRSPSEKADYRWARETVHAKLEPEIP